MVAFPRGACRLKRVQVAAREKAKLYKVEPYVIAADVYGVAPHVGRGGWTWYTGSGGWMYRLGLEGILGFKREGDVLSFDPCIPPDWPGYRIVYRCGESRYVIQVENPSGVSQGVAAVYLDGEKQENGRIPLNGDGRQYQVRVRLGN